MVNSRQKGKRGELAAAHLLNSLFPHAKARRGQQYAGTPDSPDVVTDIPGLHIEVKNREALRPYEWLHNIEMERAPGDTGLLLIKRNNLPWVAVCYAEELPQLAKTLMEKPDGVTRHAADDRTDDGSGRPAGAGGSVRPE